MGRKALDIRFWAIAKLACIRYSVFAIANRWDWPSSSLEEKKPKAALQKPETLQLRRGFAAVREMVREENGIESSILNSLANSYPKGCKPWFFVNFFIKKKVYSQCG
ncbi:hypothetical protein ABIB40_001127 [Pedobacter sp. UYP30]